MRSAQIDKMPITKPKGHTRRSFVTISHRKATADIWREIMPETQAALKAFNPAAEPMKMDLYGLKTNYSARPVEGTDHVR